MRLVIFFLITLIVPAISMEDKPHVCIICAIEGKEKTTFLGIRQHYTTQHATKYLSFYLCPYCNFAAKSHAMRNHIFVKHREIITHELAWICIPRILHNSTVTEEQMQDYSRRLYALLDTCP